MLHDATIIAHGAELERHHAPQPTSVLSTGIGGEGTLGTVGWVLYTASPLRSLQPTSFHACMQRQPGRWITDGRIPQPPRPMGH